MKFQEDQQSSNDSISSTNKKNRKKTEWKVHEDQILKKHIKRYKGKRIIWSQVALKMQEKYVEDGHLFTPKACKDRYNHYLKDGLNHDNFTEQELHKLMDLTKVHGNQWSIIAKQMNNRTEQFVKNKFYALVRKILRTLYQLIFKERNSSAITNQFRAHIISKFLCGKDDDDFIPDEEKQIRFIAKQLVFENIKINKQSQIHEQFHDKLQMVLKYMEKQNEEYIHQDKRAPNKPNSLKNLENNYSCFSVTQPPGQFSLIVDGTEKQFNIAIPQIQPKREEIEQVSPSFNNSQQQQQQQQGSILQSQGFSNYSVSEYFNLTSIPLPVFSNSLQPFSFSFMHK